MRVERDAKYAPKQQYGPEELHCIKNYEFNLIIPFKLDTRAYSKFHPVDLKIQTIGTY